MPTNYTDQFFIIDPFNPPGGGTPLNFVTYTRTDQNDDDSINGFDIQSSWPGDIVNVNVDGTIIGYEGITFYLSDGTQVFTPTDGQVLQNGTLSNASGVTAQGPLDVSDLGPPCFAAGTRIETEAGMTPIEKIEVGDLVRTLDNGLQPVRWRGRRGIAALGNRAPIRFAPNAIGNTRDLLVSPQHKMLVSGWRAELFFGEDEVLVAASHLVNADTIHRAPRRYIDYHQLMFDQHEVLLAEGVPTESLFPGDYILQDAELHDEVVDVFAKMIGQASPEWETVRTVLKSKEAAVLCGDRSQIA